MFDDPLTLARLQFALTAGTHYVFVALTLGLAPFLLFSQWRAVRLRDPARRAAVRFWGGLYVVNYAMGVLSGIVMELQLAVNWSGLTEVFGYAFAAPLAAETMAAFFVESTFLGLWIVGWDRMGRWTHLGCFAVVTLTAYASAYWVMVANGFLRNPVGFRMSDGRAVLTDPLAMALNPSALLGFAHVSVTALFVGGLFVCAVSAYHLMRGRDPEGIFRRGVRCGLVLVMAAIAPVAVTGGTQFRFTEGPTPTTGLTYGEAEIAEIEGAHDSAYSWIWDVAGGAMTVVWELVVLLTLVATVAWVARRLDRWRWFHRVLIAAPVLPYTASVGGWVYREFGRQPWTVTHHLTTAEAVTPLSPAMAAVSFTLFTSAFALLGGTTLWLLVRYARRGPEGGPLARPTAEEGVEEPVSVY
ncbi:cytochrome ubiquinol oxidase subunit I [Nocardiopsis sp. NPDC049922]|uniref:cytochrome ubiquinol oxidase subunit I n=1 Tax=Nocardiopsis sp. NPDC049922 TaxID=3155157 RepID=UPI0033EB4F3D